MDHATLVTDRVTDGRRLLEKLAEVGVTFAGAAWLQADWDAKPYLYLVSPTAGETGPQPVYFAINRALDAMHPTAIDRYEIKVVTPIHPIAKLLARYEPTPALRTQIGSAGPLPSGASFPGPTFLYNPLAPAPTA